MNNHNLLYQLICLIQKETAKGNSLSVDTVKPFLNDKITVRIVSAGNYIYSTPITKVYYVISGAFSIIRSSRDGKSTIRVQKAPSFLGIDYAVLLCKSDYLPDIFTSVQSENTCTVLEINRDFFLNSIRQDSELCFEILSEICEKFFYSSFRFDEICFYNPAAKLMNYIVNHWRSSGSPSGKHTIHSLNSLIAEEIGISPRTFYRAVNKLKAENLLTMVSGNICVTQKQLTEMNHLLMEIKGGNSSENS